MSPKSLIGVDIGGSSIKFGAVIVDSDSPDPPPQVQATRTLSGHNTGSFDAAADRLADALRDLWESLDWKAPEGVGLGVPGLVRREAGVLEEAPNLHTWDGSPVRDAMARRLGVPVAIDNDANAFALAEWRWGAGRGAQDAVFLTLGTGIGMGLVAGGRLVRGAAGFAGEPGHITLAPQGLRLGPGTSTEAEGYVGIETIVARAERHPDRGRDPLLDPTAPVTPETLFAAAERGSRVAAEVWDDVGRGLGELLVILVNILNPERVVIGGGVGQAGRWILDPARAYLAEHSLIARHAPPRIVAAKLGTEAGFLGAAALALDDAALDEMGA